MSNKIILKARHVMFDLETLSVEPTAAIMSIGACRFHPDREGEECIGETFHITLDLDTQFTDGHAFDHDTLMWWFRQSDEAREAIFKEVSFHPNRACRLFADWLDEKGTDYLWSHASFDQPILDNLFIRQNVPKAWNHRAPKDVRTVQMLCPNVSWVRTGEHHNAKDDAVTQARFVSKCLQELCNGN